MSSPIYRRVLLKLSGEVLGGEEGRGINQLALEAVCREIADVAGLGVQVGVVIGGGNILRGASGQGAAFERTRSDRMGMLATVINSLALEDALEAQGVPARVLASTPMPTLVEAFTVERARELLAAGWVVLFAGGTGHPYFSTDTAAAFRALESGAQAMLKGTKVDGVYDRDPQRFPDARRFTRLTHAEAIARNLKVMDLAAWSLCLEHRLPIHVFRLLLPGTARRLLLGEEQGTVITMEEAALPQAGQPEP